MTGGTPDGKGYVSDGPERLNDRVLNQVQVAVRAEIAPLALDPRPLTEGFTWDSRYLLFAVREPYAGAAGHTELVCGRVDARTPLMLESRMAEEGVIFSDGMLDDALPFNAGTQAEVRVADGVGRLVG